MLLAPPLALHSCGLWLPHAWTALLVSHRNLHHPSKVTPREKEFLYLRGMKRDDLPAPIPALPCLHGLYVMENSAR